MRSTHPEDQRGPRPAWNGVGLGLVAVAVVLFVLFAPARPVVQPEEPAPPTISLDDLEAMLSDSAGPPPATVQVDTPDGPVVVAIPTTVPRATTTTRPAPTTTTTAPTTTTTTTTSTTVPRTPRDPLSVAVDIYTPPTVVEGTGQ